MVFAIRAAVGASGPDRVRFSTYERAVMLLERDALGSVPHLERARDAVG